MTELLKKYGVEQYTIFGSDDSSDVDVMFYLSEMPELQICRQIATEAESLIISDKEIDVNLCVVKDGLVVDCMKGTIDEVNNMIYYTNKLHEQKYESPITKLHARDIEKKTARALRGILSFISRSQYRDIVKPALRGSASDKIEALRQIKLETITDLGKDKLVIQDFYKLFVFQLGQAIPLIKDNVELYTKKDIANEFPMFEPYLYRMLDTFPIIDVYKTYFLDIIKCKLDVTKISE
jgi:predicted nucleotidyltransferase